MLHVRMLSGQEVASVPVAEVSNVRALKQQLNLVQGMPPRFRQRLLFGGAALDDSAHLNSPMDLELVLLAYTVASETQAKQLLAAAANGSTSEASCDSCCAQS